MGKMRPLCVNCRVEMECAMNDVAVWHPCEPINIFGGELIDFVAIGDRYKCPKCGAQIVTGFGEAITAANHNQRFLVDARDSMEEQIRILR